MSRLRLLLAALPVVVAAGLAASAGRSTAVPLRWEITDLGTLGGNPSASAVGVNDAGQVVGWSREKKGGRHLFLWQAGTMRDLGDPGEVVAINERGQLLLTRAVWKRIGLADSLVASDALVWDHGHVTKLPVLGGRGMVAARAINDHGQVIGTASRRDQPMHGFIWDRGRMTDLGPYRTPVALDNAGRVAGTGATAAFLLQDGKTRSIGCTTATDLNAHSDTVGVIARQGGAAACVWDGRRRTVLPSLGGDSEAWLVNDAGSVFGTSYTTTKTPRVPHYVVWRHGRITDLGAYVNAHAVPTDIFKRNDRDLFLWNVDDYKSEKVFVWDGTRVSELPTLGRNHVTAAGVNNRGWIVGTAETKDGRNTHAVLWRPR